MKGKLTMKTILFAVMFSGVLLLSGCGKKTVKSDPRVESAMNAPVTCIKCRKKAPRVFFGRVNQVLVQCPGCKKIFPGKNNTGK
jgi:ribosomal protein L37AE/L43A